jgi:hypothetical protein
MTKTIDIRKPISAPESARIHRVGKSVEEEPVPEEKPVVAPKVRKTSFASRFIELAIFDIKRKFGLVKAPTGEFQQKVTDFEKFEEFCKTARGE